MELQIYAIRDSKGSCYHSPFYKKTPGEAQRDFQTAVNDNRNENMLNKYPEDFDLFHLGTYCDQTGKITPLAAPQHLVKAIDLKKT